MTSKLHQWKCPHDARDVLRREIEALVSEGARKHVAPRPSVIRRGIGMSAHEAVPGRGIASADRPLPLVRERYRGAVWHGVGAERRKNRPQRAPREVLQQLPQPRLGLVEIPVVSHRG